jgi:hypothetical protein
MEHVILLNTTKVPPIRMLESCGGIRLSVITEARYTGLYDRGTRVAVVDDVERLSSVREAAFGLCSDTDVDHIVSATERTLQAGGYLRSLLGLPGVPFDLANAMSNKYVMKQMLARAGVPVANFRRLMRLAELPAVSRGMKWPLIVKPILGTGAMNTFVLNRPDDFQQFHDSAVSSVLRASRVPLILEEVVDMEWEFHCEGIVRDGNLVFAAPGRYFVPVLRDFSVPNGSFMFPAGSEERLAIESICRRTVTALGLRDGVIHLEGFRTTDRYIVGEITCRPAGGGIPDIVRAQHGVDLWQAFIEISLGGEVSVATLERSSVFSHWFLPPKAGRVESLTSKDQLEALPWVVRADVTAKVGDSLGGADHSAAHVAMVVYSAACTNEALERMATLTSFFELEVS